MPKFLKRRIIEASLMLRSFQLINVARVSLDYLDGKLERLSDDVRERFFQLTIVTPTEMEWRDVESTVNAYVSDKVGLGEGARRLIHLPYYPVDKGVQEDGEQRFEFQLNEVYPVRHPIEYWKHYLLSVASSQRKKQEKTR